MWKRQPIDPQLARLLSKRSGPSVLERERAFERVMAEVQRKEQQPAARWFWRVGLASVIPAAVGLLVWLRAPASEELVARGAGVAQPQLRALCVHGEAPVPCGEGQVLAFEVAATASHPYLALFGVRTDATVVWYAPASGKPSAAEPVERHILDTGARLEGADASGLRIYGVFSARPMTRDALKQALGPELRGSGELIVVERTLAAGDPP